MYDRCEQQTLITNYDNTNTGTHVSLHVVASKIKLKYKSTLFVKLVFKLMSSIRLLM